MLSKINRCCNASGERKKLIKEEYYILTASGQENFLIMVEVTQDSMEKVST